MNPIYEIDKHSNSEIVTEGSIPDGAGSEKTLNENILQKHEKKL